MIGSLLVLGPLLLAAVYWNAKPTDLRFLARMSLTAAVTFAVLMWWES
jgi:uncharacterized membrane protein